MLAKKLELSVALCEPTSITATVRYISFRGFAALKGAAWDVTIAVGLVYLGDGLWVRGGEGANEEDCGNKEVHFE